MIDRIEITSREQWLAVRKHDVTASVVGALFNEHPYTSALKLFLMHSGVEFDDKDNSAMRRGRIMESSVAAAAAELRPDWKIEKCNAYYRDADLRLGATPDFIIRRDGDSGPNVGILQAKTVTPSVYERDWQNGAPLWIQLQTMTEMMLTGAAFGVVAALKVDPFDLDCTLVEVPRMEAVERRIVAAVRQFWDDVAAGRQPQPDPAKDAELLSVIAPREKSGKAIDLSGDNELPALLDQREQIMAGITGYEQRKSEIETQLKFLMGDAERVTGLPEWSITWKTQHRAAFSVPEKDIRTLRIHHKESS